MLPAQDKELLLRRLTNLLGLGLISDPQVLWSLGVDEASIREAISRDEESEDTLEGGLPDRDEKHPNQCLECQQWFSDEAYVRYFDKCRGCAESLPG